MYTSENIASEGLTSKELVTGTGSCVPMSYQIDQTNEREWFPIGLSNPIRMIQTFLQAVEGSIP